MIENYGYCPVCEQLTKFVVCGEWLRDYYVCGNCGSIPRQRAIIHTLQKLLPHLVEGETIHTNLLIHESSPDGKSSEYLKQNYVNYSYSFYFPNIQRGENDANGNRCEDITEMTFSGESFDVFVTQDVLEHVFDIRAACKEIARVLRPGGIHIFTVPYSEAFKSAKRAEMINGEICYYKEKVYHCNPIDEGGALVISDVGFDLADIIYESSAMTTTIYKTRDKDLGLDGEYLHVFVSRKRQ